MSERDDGGPAFPGGSRGLDLRLNEKGGVTFKNPNDGLSARDYFAAAALTGMIADGTATSPEAEAVWAYKYADAMLAARAQEAPDHE